MPSRSLVCAPLLLFAAGCLGGDSKPESCLKTEDCSARQYCAQPLGECAASGQCRQRPEICLQLYAPVCGCDGVDYANACKAAAHGASVERADTCAGD